MNRKHVKIRQYIEYLEASPEELVSTKFLSKTLKEVLEWLEADEIPQDTVTFFQETDPSKFDKT